MGHGWQFDLIFSGEPLEAGWHIEDVLVAVGGDQDRWDLLHQVALDQLHHDTHREQNIILDHK